ncbi:hypothetical protein JCM10213_009001 [Rhodosporidiobolus nylandii]
MPVASTRAHTYGEWREPFTESKLSLREWNERVYEPWLKAAYDQSIKPYYLQPSHLFNKYDSEYARGVKENLKRGIRGNVALIAHVHNSPFWRTLCELWRSKTVKEREEVVLLTWERQARRAETADFSYRRDNTPELTLNWAADPYNLEDLVAAQLLPPNSDLEYRIVRNPEWERLNAPASSLPLSPGTREFVEEGYLDRHLFLAQFTAQMIFVMTGLPEEERNIMPVSVQPTKEDYEALARSQTAGHGLTVMGVSPRDGLKRCTKCFVAEDEKKLTCCAKCKAIGRLVWECQVEDYPQHKKQCGKRLADVTTTFNPDRQNFASPRQLEVLKWLRSTPRVIWAVTNSREDEHGQLYDRNTVFNLPSFVSRYNTTLVALHAIREKAFAQKDEVSIGILALFLSLNATRVDETDKDIQVVKRVQLSDTDIQEHLDILALFLELAEHTSKSQIERAMLVAEEAVEEEKEYELIKALFAQLKTGTHDPAYPPVSPTSAFHLAFLLARPTNFFSFPSPSSRVTKPEEVPRYGMPLPEGVRPFEPTVAAVRALAFRAIESNGRDSLAVGVLMLLVLAQQGYDGDDDEPGPRLVRRWQCTQFGKELGLPEGRVQQLRDGAEHELEKQEGEEWELVRGALRQLRQLKTDRTKVRAKKQ